MGEECLMIFTKNPILGSAKTRIGNIKGDEIALKVYKKLLRYTRDITSSLSAHKVVFFNKYIEENGIWDISFQKKMQIEGNLGEKMAAAFQEEFKAYKKVIIIGSDCAAITTEDIESAFEMLEQKDIVIGPAEDGGYYLLGMKSFHQFLFSDMPWSEENLFNETISVIKSKKLSYALLPIKSDIDFWEDWESLGWDLD